MISLKTDARNSGLHVGRSFGWGKWQKRSCPLFVVSDILQSLKEL